MRLLPWRASPVGTFMVLAFGLSWALWMPVVLLFPDVSAPPWWALVLVFVGIFGPSAAALATAAIHGGRLELRSLVAKLLRWRVGWRWYALVLLGPPAFVWIGAAIYALLGGDARMAGMGWMLSAPVILASFVPFGPLGEELGWRGYALPRLDARLSPLVSSVVLGIAWAAWHLPMFWFPPVGLPARSLGTAGMWAVNVVSFSILLSFVARRTRYSVPIAILLHATLNAGGAMGFAALVAAPTDADQIGSWAGFVRWLVVLAAGLALARERRGTAEAR